MNLTSINEDTFKELKEAAQPVLDFLYKYGDPHTTVVIEMCHVNVVQGEMGMPLDIRDYPDRQGREDGK